MLKEAKIEYGSKSNEEVKYMAKYMKEELTRIRDDINFLLKRIEEAEKKYKIQK